MIALVLAALATASAAGCAHNNDVTGPPAGMPISQPLTPAQAAAARNHVPAAKKPTLAQQEKGS
jgi:uncharacterized iron-regulated membrane protein